MIQMNLLAKCNKKNQEKILKIISLLEQNPCKDCDLKKLIEDELECNWCTTRALFRRFTGVTISHVHDKLVFEKSKEHLKKHQKCVCIAVELGFKDESYFTKWFKKHEGKTPVDFKNQIITNI